MGRNLMKFYPLPEYFIFLFRKRTFESVSTNIVKFSRFFFFKSFTLRRLHWIYLVNVSVSHSEIIFKLIKHEVKGYIGCIMDGKMCRLLWAEIKSKSLSRPPQTVYRASFGIQNITHTINVAKHFFPRIEILETDDKNANICNFSLERNIRRHKDVKKIFIVHLSFEMNLGLN